MAGKILHHNTPTRRPISIHYNCLLSAFFVVPLRFISISFSAAIVVVFVGIIVVGFGSRLADGVYAYP